MTPKPTVKDTIFQAVLDLHSAGRVASRQAVAKATGMNLSVVDDHVKTLLDDGRLRRVVNGVVEPVETHPANRPMSKTVLPNGIRKLECGDEMMTLTPGEARVFGQMLTAEALELSNMRGERDTYDTVAQLHITVRNLNRRLVEQSRMLARLMDQGDLFSIQDVTAKMITTKDH